MASSSEQSLERIVGILNNILNKSNNSAAFSSANNKSGIYGEDETVSSSTTTNLEKLSKAAEKASKKINMDDAVNKISEGFSSILKETGKSIRNAVSLKPSDRILSSSLSQVRNDLYKSSSLVKDAISDTIEKLTSIDGLNMGKFLHNSKEMSQSMAEFNDIMGKIAKTGRTSETQTQRIKEIYGELGDDTKKLIKTFGGADDTINDFIDGVISGSKIKEKIDKESIDSFKKFNKSLNDNREIFSGAVLHMNNMVNTNINEPLQNFRKEATQLGPKMLRHLKVGFSAAAAQTGNAVNTIMRDGFRDASIGGLASTAYNAADFGQGQTEFLTNIREFRNVIRLFGDNANVMKVVASESFNTLSESVRNDFNIVGKENTQLVTSMMDTLIELGIKPTTSAILGMKDNFKNLGVRDNKDVVQIAGIFNALSKDKAFKAYTLMQNKGKDAIGSMTKTFHKLQKTVGMTLDEFSDYQKELSGRMRTKGTTRIVQAAMRSQLLENIGGVGALDRVRGKLKKTRTNSEIMSLLNEGNLSPGSLTGANDEDYQTLFAEMKRVLTEKNTLAEKKFAKSDSQDKVTLDVLAEGAGMDLLAGAGMQTKLKSGYIDMLSRSQATFDKTANLQSTFFTQMIAFFKEKGMGLSKGPIGAIGGAIITSVGSFVGQMSLLLTAQSMLINGVKETIAHPILSKKGILTNTPLEKLKDIKSGEKLAKMSNKIDKLNATGNSATASKLEEKLATKLDKASNATMKSYLDNIMPKEATSKIAKVVPFLRKLGVAGAVLGTGIDAKEGMDKAISEGKSDSEVTGRGLLGAVHGFAGFFTGISTAVASLPKAWDDNITMVEALTKGYVDGSKFPEMVTGALGDAVYAGITGALETMDSDRGYIDRQNAAMHYINQQSIKRSPQEAQEIKSYLNNFKLSEAQIKFNEKNQPKVEDAVEKVLDFLDRISGHTDVTNKTLEKQHQEKQMKDYLAKQQQEANNSMSDVLGFMTT